MVKKAIVLDFDGTITKNDVGEAVVKTFAAPGWEKFELLWRQRKLSTQECVKSMWGSISESYENLLKFVSDFELNDGFHEFHKYIMDNKYKFLIASDGFDFYINHILKKNGYEDFEIYCNHIEYNDGWKFDFPYSSKDCGLCGNCKKAIVDKLKDDGFRVYYAGDGFSDRCGCTNADVIFAKRHLADHCDLKGIPYIKFDNYYEILNYLEDENERDTSNRG